MSDCATFYVTRSWLWVLSGVRWLDGRWNITVIFFRVWGERCWYWCQIWVCFLPVSDLCYLWIYGDNGWPHVDALAWRTDPFFYVWFEVTARFEREITEEGFTPTCIVDWEPRCWERSPWRSGEYRAEGMLARSMPSSRALVSTEVRWYSEE